MKYVVILNWKGPCARNPHNFLTVENQWNVGILFYHGQSLVFDLVNVKRLCQGVFVTKAFLVWSDLL